MKQIKLTGRERSVLRSIDFATGASGAEILDRTKLPSDELVDILNGLIGVGYVELIPYGEATTVDALANTTFEVNPSYALQLREAMMRGV